MLHHLSYEHFEVKLWYVINTTTYVHLERFDYAPSSDLRTLWGLIIVFDPINLHFEVRLCYVYIFLKLVMHTVNRFPYINGEDIFVFLLTAVCTHSLI